MARKPKAPYNGGERDDRGGLNPANIYASAKRAARHMTTTKPTSGTYGKSEAHAADARKKNGAAVPPTGSFDTPKRSARTEHI